MEENLRSLEITENKRTLPDSRENLSGREQKSFLYLTVKGIGLSLGIPLAAYAVGRAICYFLE